MMLLLLLELISWFSQSTLAFEQLVIASAVACFFFCLCFGVCALLSVDDDDDDDDR